MAARMGTQAAAGMQLAAACRVQRPAAAPRSVAARAGAKAGAGFGKSSKKRVDLSGGMAVPPPKPAKQQQGGADAGAAPTTSGAGGAAAAAGGASGSGWATVGKVEEMFPLGKDAKAVILPSGVKLCVYKHAGKVYASQLESTAYQFPLFDGKVFTEGGRVLVEVPLDGTQYDLSNGQVVKWCPKEGNPLRGLLGTLKSNQQQVPIKVAADGTVSVKLI